MQYLRRIPLFRSNIYPQARIHTRDLGADLIAEQREGDAAPHFASGSSAIAQRWSHMILPSEDDVVSVSEVTS